MTPQTLPLLLVLIAASSIATTVLAMSVEAVMTVSTPPEQFGRVSARQNAGHLGGAGSAAGSACTCSSTCRRRGWRVPSWPSCWRALDRAHARRRQRAHFRSVRTGGRRRTGLLACTRSRTGAKRARPWRASSAQIPRSLSWLARWCCAMRQAGSFRWSGTFRDSIWMSRQGTTGRRRKPVCSRPPTC
jgi:hypothetical protein